MSRPQDIGAEFEAAFVERHGLKKVAASGSQWHSKLDARGRGARWSLKATADASYRITPKDIFELVSAHAPGSDGAIRLMAIQVGTGEAHETTLIVMLEDDFTEIATGELELVSEDKTQAKRRLASIPELLREADDGE